MSNKRALTDIAYDVISEQNTAMGFADIWKDVLIRTGESNADIAQFFTDMTLDGRFINLPGNQWDLKQNHKFEETYVNIDDISLEDDEDEELVEEEEDESFENTGDEE